MGKAKNHMNICILMKPSALRRWLAGRAGFMPWSRDVAAFACLIYREIFSTTTVQDIYNMYIHYPAAKEHYFKLPRYQDLPVSQSSRCLDVKIPFSSEIGGKLSNWLITSRPFESSYSAADRFLSLSARPFQWSQTSFDQEEFHFMHLALSLWPDIPKASFVHNIT